ncbi:DDE_3 domain-containing protein [Trichonephila clavipes]|nr:DDE_3 domain-containing protein [Trichonephila clavipes]
MLLGVLMCLVVWSTVSGINIKPKHLCPEDMFQADHKLQHLQEHQGEEYPLVRCECVFTIYVSMQGDQLCVYPSTNDGEWFSYLGQENAFPGPDSDGLLYSLQTSPDSHWRVIQNVCSTGGNKSPDIINPTLLKDTLTEVVEQWLGRDLTRWSH